MTVTTMEFWREGRPAVEGVRSVGAAEKWADGTGVAALDPRPRRGPDTGHGR
jgi:hypothetical protein